MTKTSKVEIRVTQEEKEAWVKASGSQSVSEWLRGLANDEVDDPWPKTGPMAELGQEEFMPRVNAAMKAKCPRAHFHNKGVFCKSCNKTN